MAVFTTRLNLKKPAGGSSGTIPGDDQADIDDINNNSDIIDAAMGTLRVASSGKPATPYDGQMIALTDANDMPQLRAGADWKNPGIIGRGTTAQRNAYYPVPGNAAARVALANSFALWYNTEKGWLEQYYAQFDDAGVGSTTPTRTVFGWKPAMELGQVPIPIGPATVASSGTVSKRGNSIVVTANAVSIDVDNIFNDDFEDYLIRVVGTVPVVGGAILQLRAAGVLINTATYELVGMDTGATNGSNVTTPAANTADRFSLTASPGGAHHAEIILYRPKLALDTLLYSAVGIGNSLRTLHGQEKTAAARDGFRIGGQSGALYGPGTIVSIFGLNKAN